MPIDEFKISVEEAKAENNKNPKTVNAKQLEEAFAKWVTQKRNDPEKFFKQEDVDEMTPEEYAAISARYLIGLCEN